MRMCLRTGGVGVQCDHRRMVDEYAHVLARGGNTAVTHLAGRTFPGLHIQGDTFAELQRSLADAAGRLRRGPTEAATLDDLDNAIAEMAQMLRFYESVLDEHDIRLPYLRDAN